MTNFNILKTILNCFKAILPITLMNLGRELSLLAKGLRDYLLLVLNLKVRTLSVS